MMKPLLLALLLLAGCKPATPPKPKTDVPPDHAFATQINAVKKAQAVEQTVLDADAAQRKQIDKLGTQP